MTIQISQLASVDPRAEIADDVEIGPFCRVGPHVRIGSGTRLRIFLEQLPTFLRDWIIARAI